MYDSRGQHGHILDALAVIRAALAPAPAARPADMFRARRMVRATMAIRASPLISGAVGDARGNPSARLMPQSEGRVVPLHRPVGL